MWPIILAIIIFVSLCWTQRRQGTILTSTTFFDFKKDDHWATFCRGIDSIIELHSPETVARITKWFVINEWSAEPREDWATLIHDRYPFIVFVQKSEQEKGQAVSLNRILEEISPYEYWIHWEEAWYAETPFLDRAFHVMDTTAITQLQLTTTNGNIDWKEGATCGPEYCIVKPTPKYYEYDIYTVDWGAAIHHWPCYSLRPSINRAVFYQGSSFRTDPKLWPGRFEWDYGVQWFCKNGVKGILPDGPVRRSPKHVSTYG